MNRYLATLFLMLFYTGESYQCHPLITSSKIEAVEVLMIDPVMGDDSYRVYFWKNMIMYEAHYRYDSTVSVMRHDSTKVPLFNTVSEKRTSYFVFEKDSLFGYNFDPATKDLNNLRLSVDSILKIRTLQSASLDTAISIKPDTTSWNINKTELREVYFFPAKENIPSVRWVLSYATKLNHVKISFSRLLDSSKAMKLYKVETLIDSFFVKNENKLWPAMKYSNEIKEIPIENTAEILDYFERYEVRTRKSIQK